MDSMDISSQDMKDVSKKRKIWAYGIAFLCAVLTSYVLALFLQNLFVPSLNEALKISIFASIGIIISTQLSLLVFTQNKKQYKGMITAMGYYAITLFLQALIIYLFS